MKVKQLFEDIKKYKIYHDAQGRWLEIGNTYYVLKTDAFKHYKDSSGEYRVDNWKDFIVFSGSSKVKCQEWIKKHSESKTTLWRYFKYCRNFNTRCFKLGWKTTGSN
jgi:hypothetical protein